MKPLDRELQRQRIAKALRFIPQGAFVLDVGCADGAFFRAGRERIATGVGIDLQMPQTWVDGPYELRVGEFPDVLNPGETFDAIVMLAVVEHAPLEELRGWAKVIPELLVSAGLLVITTPSPKVDQILDLLMKLRMLDGMEAHEHHGFDPRTVPEIFGGRRLSLIHKKRFQLGLNHLFVLRRA